MFTLQAEMYDSSLESLLKHENLHDFFHFFRQILKHPHEYECLLAKLLRRKGRGGRRNFFKGELKI